MIDVRSWRFWRSRRPWRSGSIWLAVIAMVAFVCYVSAPDFETIVAPDTQGYVWKLQHLTPAAVLGAKRTFGYPLFLAAVRLVDSDQSRVAEAQLALFLATAVAFGAAVRVFSGSWATGVAAALPLFVARMIPMQATRIMSDMAAAAAAVATVALLLVLVARPASKLAWAGLALAVFLTYQTRPACLFLVALVPVLALLLTLLRQGAGAWRRALVNPFALLCLLTFSPFLLWSALRWATVRHFGLVSFGGANTIGLTTPMVTPEVIPTLPPEFREFARTLLAVRHRRNLPPLAPDYDYQRWVREYNTNAHLVAPKAWQRVQARHAKKGGKPITMQAYWVEANRYFTRFSLAVIRARPDVYRRWLAGSCQFTWSLLSRDRVTRWSTQALAVALGLWALSRLVRWRIGNRDAPPPETASTERRATRVPPSVELLVVALGFFVASQLLVMLVEVPQDRYTFLSAIFLPSAFLAAALDLVRAAFRFRTGTAPA